MIHSNPFSSVGHDLHALQAELHRKADSHEVSTLRSHVDRLECALREVSAASDGLRRECQELQARVDRLEQAEEAPHA